MDGLTKTERRLCKMWASAEMSGDFWELNMTLFEISNFLAFEGARAEVIDDFAFLATLALNRAVYAIKDKEERVAA